MIICIMRVNTMKYTQVYAPCAFITSYMTYCQSSPVVHRNRSKKAMWKFEKLNSELITPPVFTLEKRNTPRMEKMKYNRNINAVTFSKAGREKRAVSINFLNPCSCFTRRNRRVTLRTRKTLAIWGPTLTIDDDPLPMMSNIMSRMDVSTTKKSN